MTSSEPSLLLLVVPWVFVATLACALVLLMVCHIAPDRLARWNSVPWAFQLKRAADTELHCALYSAYHGTRLAQLTHWFFLLDVVAWFALLWGAHAALFSLTLAALLFLATRVRGRLMRLSLLVVWAGGAALAIPVTHALGGAAAPWAMALLLANSALRVLGHVAEPVPPLIGEAIDRFRPLAEVHLGARALLIAWIGYLSEFAAGFPWGLIRVHAAWAADRLRTLDALAHARSSEPWEAATSLGAQIRASGFRAYPPLAALIQPYLRRATSPSAPSPQPR